MTQTDLAGLRAITMQDVRLVAGEGKLSAHHVLDAINVILRQRRGDLAENRNGGEADTDGRISEPEHNDRPRPEPAGGAASINAELVEAAKHLVDFIDQEGPCAKEWEAISAWTEKLRAAIANYEAQCGERAANEIHSSDGSTEGRAISGTGSTSEQSRQPETPTVGVEPGPSETTAQRAAEPVAWGERYSAKLVSVSLTRGKFHTIPLYEHPTEAQRAAEPTSEQVVAAAALIATSPLIDAPKLPAECWMGLARSVLEAALSAPAAEQQSKGDGR